ncbi:MAG: hypothetical protein WC602_03610 [archaeon]
MQIMLISSNEAGINFFPEMIERLSAEVSDADFQYFFAPTDLDIPMQVKEVIASAELVFVFMRHDENDWKQRFVLEKLVDLELEHNVKIVKALESRESESFSILDFPVPSESNPVLSGKSELAEKWSAYLLRILFEPDSFNPEPESEAESGSEE